MTIDRGRAILTAINVTTTAINVITTVAPIENTAVAVAMIDDQALPAGYDKNYAVAAAGTVIRSCRRVGPPARIWMTPAANPISAPICQAVS